MKKIVFFAVAVLSVCTSCKKASYPGGSWTFLSGTYSATSCSGGIGTLTATNVDNNNAYTYGTIACNFYHALPTAGGTFHIVPYPPLAADQMSVGITINGGSTSYSSTPDSGMETVSVKVAANGYISVTGSGIEMLNTGSGSDSSALSIALTQTQ